MYWMPHKLLSLVLEAIAYFDVQVDSSCWVTMKECCLVASQLCTQHGGDSVLVVSIRWLQTLGLDDISTWHDNGYKTQRGCTPNTPLVRKHHHFYPRYKQLKPALPNRSFTSKLSWRGYFHTNWSGPGPLLQALANSQLTIAARVSSQAALNKVGKTYSLDAIAARKRFYCWKEIANILGI